MRRALDLENRVGDRLTASSEFFLELRLEVDVAVNRVVDPVREGLDDRLPNRLEPMLEVQGAEGGLDDPQRVRLGPAEPVLGKRQIQAHRDRVDPVAV